MMTLDRKTKANLRKIGVGVALFGVVAIDFGSKLLSIGFDALFAVGIAVLLWPLLTSDKQ